MDYRYVVFACIGLAWLIAVLQQNRTPEEIMRAEKPDADTFITRIPPTESLEMIEEVAKRYEFTTHRKDSCTITMTSKTSPFSWGYVLHAESESPTDWNYRITLSLYMKAETGYGNRILSNKKLSALIKDIRHALMQGPQQ